MQTKEYFAELRAKRRAAGLCASCGKHPSPCERCRAWNREYMRKKRAGIPHEERKKLWITKRGYYLRRKFGITEEDYSKMLEDQGGVCAICGSDDPGEGNKNFPVDHCHKTGKVRGILCGPCNKGLGHFRDNVETLLKAIDYIKNKE